MVCEWRDGEGALILHGCLQKRQLTDKADIDDGLIGDCIKVRKRQKLGIECFNSAEHINAAGLCEGYMHTVTAFLQIEDLILVDI